MPELLREFGPNLRVADGPTLSFFGFPYATRMALIALADGSLFVWSPIALTPELGREVDALGTVRHLVSPNRLHHLFLGEWKTAYPQALLYASPGLRRKRRDLAFDADLGERPDPAWAGEIDQIPIPGSLITEVVFFHRRSATVLFTDLLQNHPRGWFRGWRGVVARLDGIVAPHPGTPREWRASFVRRKAARAALNRVLDWPIERVLIAHGESVTTDGKAFVRQAFSWLLR